MFLSLFLSFLPSVNSSVSTYRGSWTSLLMTTFYEFRDTVDRKHCPKILCVRGNFKWKKEVQKGLPVFLKFVCDL